jgi:prepilin-type N-terminal cleavage/methylation domain-containing protein
MNNKGITLIELIAVLAILAALAIIVTPRITNILSENRSTLKTIQESSIKEAAEMYVSDKVGEEIFIDEETSSTITLQTLVNGGYIDGELKNDKTKKELDLNQTTVTVTKENNGYVYSVNMVDKHD